MSIRFDMDSSDGHVTELFGTRNILAYSLKRVGCVTGTFLRTHNNGGGGRGGIDLDVLRAY